MKFALKFFFFLVLNFAALGIGSLLMGGEVQGEWYSNLNKAPWTPPGWVFGFAWTSIMILYSAFMAFGTKNISLFNFTHTFTTLFWLQWILNILWNGLFFRWHLPFIGLLEIVFLFVVLIFQFRWMWNEQRIHTLWILPYLLWLVVAISLNAYVVLMN